jgi:fibronectin type 3 domain-containing protein
MKRRLLVLWMALVVGLALLSMCGSGRVGYQGGYDAALGAHRGGYSAGGAPAGWDTLVVIFTPETLVAGALAYPGSPTAYDIARTDTLNGLIAEADTVHILGTGNKVVNFAYGVVDSLRPFGQASTFGQMIQQNSRPYYSLNGQGYLSMKYAYPADGDSLARTSQLIYLPFEKYIPANATIVAATIEFAVGSNMYWTSTDSMIAVLMDNPNDDEWYKQKGITNYPDWAETSWRHQNSSKWGGTRANPWVPQLNDRTHDWHWGKVNDWSGSPKTGGDYFREKANVSVKITNCVQAIVAGSVNNGINLIWHNYANVDDYIRTYVWDNYGSIIGRTPLVRVKYITKRYQKPFGTSDVVLVASTDDGRYAANRAYTDTFKAHGGKYTIYMSNQQIGVPSGGPSTPAQLVAFRTADGMEVGSHGFFHKATKGYTFWHSKGMADTNSAGWDSLMFDARRSWMYDMADTIAGDLRADPLFARSTGLPESQWSPEVMLALQKTGYVAARTGNTTQTYDRTRYLQPASMGAAAAARSDSISAGVPSQSGRYARNMFGIPLSFGVVQLFGYKVNASSTEAELDSIKINVSRALFQVRGQDRGILPFAWHDFKTAPSVAGYNEGIDGNELGAALDVCDEWGVPMWAVSDYARWIKAGATAVDSPNRAAVPDTFESTAAQRVWFKPNGVDNRWIRGLRTPQAVVNSFDSTAPSAPTLSVASGSNDMALLVWDASSSPDVQYYNIYRFFDGAADTVKIGTATATNYFDNTAINGSPHNYYVKAVDYAGNESAASATMTTTPGTILSLASPAYFGFWYQDAADSTPLSDADVSKLAAYDAVVCSPHPLELNDETGYDNLVARVRATNPDAIMLTYFDGLTPWHDWGVSFPAGSSGKRIWDYCISAAADSGAFAKDISGDVVHGDVYPNQMFYNVMNTTLADTIASILVDVIQQTGVDGEYTGFFIDDADTLLANWICNGGECGDFIDYDQDTVAFNDDADEKSAVQNWHIDFARAMRREFAENNMPNRLLVPNGSWGRSAYPSPKQAAYMGLIDGYLNENWNQYWPGHAIATDTAKWDLALGMASQLTHAQTSPPLVFWSARTDSSDQFMNEVISMATAGFVGANNSSDIHGTTGVPVMGRRIAALEPSGSASIQYGEVAANASPDTLAVTRGNLVGRMILGRANPDSAAFVWPYVIYTATGDTLSRSLYWERAGEEGAPPVAQSQILTGDRMLTLAIGAGLGDYVPSDFSHFLIAREYKISSTAYYDTFTVDPDTLDSVYGATGSWWWYDTGLTNGRQYKYKVFSVDVLGNVGPPAPQVTQTPNDNTPPAVPADLVASGGDGFVDLDWSFPVVAADFAHFRIWRALGDGAFALHDSVTISAHQDSTAISGQDYRYKVVSVDDDWNASLPSSIATGAWIGSPPATYLAPQLVRVIPNYTSTATAVLVYPPQDVTGLTGYTVYRGPWNGVASTDTTACIKRISINATPDSYNAHTFIDNTANTTPDSAFQYTAVALYSGNRSAKYSPPAGAFTDGGFAVTTPTLAAFGNGTNILLGVGSVSGADSTRVYRGTGAGTQTSLASINALDNPYTDTTAAANTDYWYKVRQYDVATAMWSNYSAVSGPVRWTSVPSGDPTISGVTGGSLSHGETVTISGANFGAKATAAPMLYDDFDSYSEGQSASTSHGWSDVSALDGVNVPIYSAVGGHSGKGLVGRFIGSNAISRVRLDRDWSNGAYLDYWYMMVEDSSGLRSRNMKPWRFYGNGGGSDEYPQVNVFAQCADGSVQLPVSMYGTTGSNYYMTPISAMFTTMKHWQVWLKPDLTGGSAGSFRVTIDGVVVEEANGTWKSQDATLAGNHWYQLSISGYFSKSAEGSCPPANLTGNAYEYWDNWYIDDTQARVEIGTSTTNPSNPTYAQCDHREIQIPSSWAAGSIGITVNTGSFANGGAYLFVIDEDGTASAGQAITISN